MTTCYNRIGINGIYIYEDKEWKKRKLVFGDDKLWLIYRNPKEAKKKKIEECKSSDSNFPQHPQN